MYATPIIVEPAFAPLADRMRPRSLAEVIGQEHLTAPGCILYQALTADRIPSLVFWGPPGCGKTTLARVIASQTKNRFEAISAVLSGVRELRDVAIRAKAQRQQRGLGTILFVDEIHRFNKSQQDAFLPFVEDGTIVLVGATTENPSFELNAALLSRCRVLLVNALSQDHLLQLLNRALTEPDPQRGIGNHEVTMADGVLAAMADQADGDGRYALNMLETFVETTLSSGDKKRELSLADLQESLTRRAALYDKAGEVHYNLISALHKSMRGSDVDAALYWLARMLVGGEGGLYIARRMVRFATEDIGNADPQALAMALQAKDAYHFLGSPEGDLALAQGVIYLCTAPKSNSVYQAYGAAKACAEEKGSPPPPLHIRNAPTRLMKDLGYGKDYQYPHDYEGAFVNQDYLPESLKSARFYQPVERGYEREIAKRLTFWRRLKKTSE